MTERSIRIEENFEDIPNPDALGLIPIFEAPAGEEHPDELSGAV